VRVLGDDRLLTPSLELAGQARLSGHAAAYFSQSQAHEATAEGHVQLYSSLLPSRRAPSGGDAGGHRRGVTAPPQVLAVLRHCQKHQTSARHSNFLDSLLSPFAQPIVTVIHWSGTIRILPGFMILDGRCTNLLGFTEGWLVKHEIGPACAYLPG
jgi:hypothetical protein